MQTSRKKEVRRGEEGGEGNERSTLMSLVDIPPKLCVDHPAAEVGNPFPRCNKTLAFLTPLTPAPSAVQVERMGGR